MGLLKLFSRHVAIPPKLPFGSFTVDRQGQVLVSTLPQSFPRALQRDIGQRVLKSFQAAREANLNLTELRVCYAGFKLVARNLHGSAIVFLSPVAPLDPSK